MIDADDNGFALALRRGSDSCAGRCSTKNFFALGSVQPIEKAHFRQENPRNSRHFSLIGLGWIRADFAGFE
jgi:hypothetical protein